MHDACVNWNFEAASRLIQDFNADMTKADKNGIIPAHKAIQSNHVDMIECLIAGIQIKLIGAEIPIVNLAGVEFLIT